MMEPKEPKNILILCVDVDDDVGEKTGLRTPMIGKEQVLNAAIQLITKDPEEADANTLFEGLRILESLRARAIDEKYEIAAVSGSSRGGLEADRKIAKEVQEVVRRSSAEAIILVSDGFTDQAVSPIIQSYAPIISVRRFAVKHSESLEVNWLILSKYLNMLFSDPRYTRWTLGIPGIALVIFSVFYILNLLFPESSFLAYATIFIIALLGFALMVKGFGIDKAMGAIVSEVAAKPAILIKIFSLIAGIVVFILGINQGIGLIPKLVPPEYLTDPMTVLNHLNFIMAAFIDVAVLYITIGIAIIFLGRVFYASFAKSSQVWSNLAALVASILSCETLRRATGILTNIPSSPLDPSVLAFFLWIAFSILTMIASTLVIHRLRRFYQNRPMR
jgi:putative membrane protein